MFSILADETADISGVEQVSLCVRYINSNTLKLTEEFLQFVPTNDMTLKGIANLILENLQQFGINTQYLRGQGYGEAAVMAGKLNGVQCCEPLNSIILYYVHSIRIVCWSTARRQESAD